ncbi:unnamed protein product [Albugo candida]|uniref:Sperm-tail PG-rich repeat-containing protein 2 n=1 Tax=Albugo candida TaxID=65357 RepID=A0A024GQD1_9STRA|nr:unnamed protein product [Albugo candida]|eukprot:CCI49109.1 unnamed protein product [Albugo candida]
MHMPTAPSIPSLSQSFGYEQRYDGKLVRHTPKVVRHSGVGDDTTGPGEYNALEGIKKLDKHISTDFGKTKVGKQLVRMFDDQIKTKANIPGPGYYGDLDADTHRDAFNASAVFSSCTTRELSGMKILVDNVPGPGSYQRNGDTFRITNIPEHLQFFGSTSARFTTLMSDSPACGPGSYEVYPRLLVAETSKKSRRQAFLDPRLSRFEDQRTRNVTPAPGAYYNANGGRNTNCKSISFGKSAERFSNKSFYGLKSKPEDAFENLMNKQNQEKKLVDLQKRFVANRKARRLASSSFVSKSDRFQGQVREDGPCPGDYEVGLSWEASGARRSFQSAIKRFERSESPRHVGITQTENTVPSATRAASFATEPRFSCSASLKGTPGPGHYNSRTVVDSWHKPTHNVTIATEMELARRHDL